MDDSGPVSIRRLGADTLPRFLRIFVRQELQPMPRP
jgi:hypothetical protein